MSWGAFKETFLEKSYLKVLWEYSLFRCLSSFSDMLYNCVIARFLTLIFIRCPFIHFFFNHRPQSVTNMLSEIFHKFIAEINI